MKECEHDVVYEIGKQEDLGGLELTLGNCLRCNSTVCITDAYVRRDETFLLTHRYDSKSEFYRSQKWRVYSRK